MKWVRTILRFAVGCLYAVLIVGSLALLIWVTDVWRDRRHTIVIESETPIFVGPTDLVCHGTRLSFAEAGATFRVQRIRYYKNCATLDIKLPDGQKGYVTFGEGEFRVLPPLN
jgi:hypothetical protein